MNLMKLAFHSLIIGLVILAISACQMEDQRGYLKTARGGVMGAPSQLKGSFKLSTAKGDPISISKISSVYGSIPSKDILNVSASANAISRASLIKEKTSKECKASVKKALDEIEDECIKKVPSFSMSFCLKDKDDKCSELEDGRYDLSDDITPVESILVTYINEFCDGAMDSELYQLPAKKNRKGEIKVSGFENEFGTLIQVSFDEVVLENSQDSEETITLSKKMTFELLDVATCDDVESDGSDDDGNDKKGSDDEGNGGKAEKTHPKGGMKTDPEDTDAEDGNVSVKCSGEIILEHMMKSYPEGNVLVYESRNEQDSLTGLGGADPDEGGTGSDEVPNLAGMIASQQLTIETMTILESSPQKIHYTEQTETKTNDMQIGGLDTDELPLFSDPTPTSETPEIRDVIYTPEMYDKICKSFKGNFDPEQFTNSDDFKYEVLEEKTTSITVRAGTYTVKYLKTKSSYKTGSSYQSGTISETWTMPDSEILIKSVDETETETLDSTLVSRRIKELIEWQK